MQNHDRLKDALKLIDYLSNRVEKLEYAANEAIAIIGIGCRFPGGVSDTATYWNLLTAGQDAISEVPPNRWNLEEWFDEDPDTPGKMYSRWGGFLDNLDEFDPAFFGISPLEAKSIDPQQRLLLEVSWEALENAGMTKQALFNSNTGVYVGLYGAEYQTLAVKDAEKLNAYSFLGTLHSATAGRLSYWLGLKGPNIAIDTACSSSLVSVHMAVQALRNSECSMALAGGVNMILSPEGTVYLSQLKGLSPTGRCHAFSAAGDGFVRSEGCGMVVLKRLSDAQQDGDHILALIKGSAVNQDGQSNGFTAPNGPSQQAVIRKALQQAAIEPQQVDYIEAHGTGTPLGDPIEVHALAKVLSENREAHKPIKIGSVKSNIGHTEAAAGIAGLIKVVLCLQHQQIPPSIHFDQPNPHIQWEDIPVQVVRQLSPWKRSDEKPRIAGLSGFGLSGTNAHIILEEAPLAPTDEDKTALPPRQQQLFVLSANEEAALLMQAQQLIQLIQKQPDIQPQALAYNLANHRSHFPFRVAFIAQDIPDLLQALQDFTEQKDSPALSSGLNSPSSNEKQPSSSLVAEHNIPSWENNSINRKPSSNRLLINAARSPINIMPLDLLDIIFAQPDSEQEKLLHRIDYMQPALFAYQYAMYQLWSAWGIHPQVLIGHSLGEIVAACVAGLFSLEDGIKLICYRGMLMQSLPPGGAMLSLQAPAEEVQNIIQKYPSNKVAIGVINGPLQTVVSGQKDTVIEIQKIFDKQQVKTKILQVSHASHSPADAARHGTIQRDRQHPLFQAADNPNDQ